jgi:hypothetical protein
MASVLPNINYETVAKKGLERLGIDNTDEFFIQQPQMPQLPQQMMGVPNV